MTDHDNIDLPPEDEDYLWNGSGAVDPEFVDPAVAELEDLLGTLRYDGSMPAVEVAPTREPNRMWWLAAAAGIFLVAWGWVSRQGADFAPPVARMNIPSVTVSTGVASVPTVASSTIVPSGPSWDVVSVAGTPTANGQPIGDKGRVRVGEWLETDGDAKAKLTVADIGTVDIEPGTRLRLLSTQKNNYRVQLSRGLLRATVNAPPRVFLVETPNVTAVDLGCEYQLEVADDGSSWLRVRTGWVSLETKDVVSVVPAGAMCRADASGVPGLPLRRAAPEAYVAAAARFVATRDIESSTYLVKNATRADAVTLWHLLSRVPATERRMVYDGLAKLKQAATDEAAVLQLDKDALDTWGRALDVLPPLGWPNDDGPPDQPAPEWNPADDSRERVSPPTKRGSREDPGPDPRSPKRSPKRTAPDTWSPKPPETWSPDDPAPKKRMAKPEEPTGRGSRERQPD